MIALLRRHLTASRLAGLLTALALVTAGCAVLAADDPYEVEVEFARTFNLFPGSPVRVLGVEVGSVKDLSVAPGDESVTATLLIDPDVELPAEASALIVPESLLGERYVQIDPPYTGGETLAAGATIPRERTSVPYEFDEVLDSLNQFVGGLEPDEVGRFVSNVAEVVDGNGESLGRTIDNARTAIGVLRENDDEIVALAGRLADLNETLATRDEEIGAILEDWNAVATAIVSERGDLSAALDGLVRLTAELGEVLTDHRADLQRDVEALTRVGRTANRNLDQLSLAILGGAELFRHAERVIDRDQHNWLPLVNHFDDLGRELAETLVFRLEGLCLASGLSPQECEQIPLEDIVGGDVCLPGVIPCDEDSVTMAEAIREVVEQHPELGDALLDDGTDDTSGDEADDATDDGLTDDVGDVLDGLSGLESSAGGGLQ